MYTHRHRRWTERSLSRYEVNTGDKRERDKTLLRPVVCNLKVLAANLPCLFLGVVNFVRLWLSPCSMSMGLRKEWEAQYINDLVDSYGQEWTYEERKILEHTCYSAIMVSVVVTQWADLIVCKTRHNSIFKQGMGNWTLNFSLIVETALACFLCYCPYMYYLKFYPVRLRWWLYSMPFSVLIFIFDELRKWQIRTHPKGWFRRETYY